MGARCYVALALACVLSAGVFSMAVASWWGMRGNHLHGLGNWVVGKDTGKFVFYTYAFMFDPLAKGRIDLASHMGFQEIRYRQSEDTSSRLDALSVDCAISKECYLWVTLHASPEARYRVRLSNHAKYRSGFYAYDGRDRLVSYQPFVNEPDVSEAWRQLSGRRGAGGVWIWTLDGAVLGTWNLEDASPGWFGFQGSGRPRSHVFIQNVEGAFRGPDGRLDAFSEQFTPRLPSLSVWMVLVGVGGLVGLLRVIRNYGLAGVFGVEHRLRWLSWDHLAYGVVLGIGALCCSTSSGVHLPGSFVAAELVTLVLFRVVGEPVHAASRSRKWVFGGYLAMATIILLAVGRHGEWLGRESRQIWSLMEQIDPSAFRVVPDGSRTAQAESYRDVEVGPGQPLFTTGGFTDQSVDLTFQFDDPGTLDLVFQQQGYLTQGDAEGEVLPLQRKLIRLSTVDGVESGVASGLQKQPYPLYALAGRLLPDEINHLQIHARGDRLEVVLNGQSSAFIDQARWGVGLTGLMVHDGRVRVPSFQVEPLGYAGGVDTRRLIKAGCLLIFLPLFVVGVLRWGGTSLDKAMVIGCGVLFVPAMACVCSLLLSTERLAYQGTLRILWLDVVWLGVVVGLAACWLAPGLGKRARVCLFNAWFTGLLGIALLCVYDNLPAEHPLRARRIGTVPAEQDVKKTEGHLPWYARNKSIGANNYVWQQRFGPRESPGSKLDGACRVFVMGGSQSWGSGAADSFSTWDALLERRLRDENGGSVKVFNAGVNGAGIAMVRDFYLQVVRRCQPDVLVLDVGLNDSAALRQVADQSQRARERDRRVRAFESIVDAAAQDGTRVVLVLEAMSRESALRPDTALYSGWSERAVSRNIPVVDAMSKAGEVEFDHAIWWDGAHFSPAGHEFLAEWVAPAVRKILQPIDP